MPLVAMNGNVGELSALALFNEASMYDGIPGGYLGYLGAAAKAKPLTPAQQKQLEKLTTSAKPLTAAQQKTVATLQAKQATAAAAPPPPPKPMPAAQIKQLQTLTQKAATGQITAAQQKTLTALATKAGVTPPPVAAKPAGAACPGKQVKDPITGKCVTAAAAAKTTAIQTAQAACDLPAVWSEKQKKCCQYGLNAKNGQCFATAQAAAKAGGTAAPLNASQQKTLKTLQDKAAKGQLTPAQQKQLEALSKKAGVAVTPSTPSAAQQACSLPKVWSTVQKKCCEFGLDPKNQKCMTKAQAVKAGTAGAAGCKKTETWDAKQNKCVIAPKQCKGNRTWDATANKGKGGCVAKSKAGKPITEEQDKASAAALNAELPKLKKTKADLFNRLLKTNPKQALRIAQKYPNELSVTEAQKAVAALPSSAKKAPVRAPAGKVTAKTLLQKPMTPAAKAKLRGFLGYLGIDTTDATAAMTAAVDPAMSQMQIMSMMQQGTPPKGCDRNPNKPVCAMYNMSQQQQQMMMMVMMQIQSFQQMIMELISALGTGTADGSACAAGTVAQYGPDGAMICVPDGSINITGQCDPGYLLDEATQQCIPSGQPGCQYGIDPMTGQCAQYPQQQQQCPPGYMPDGVGGCAPYQQPNVYDEYGPYDRGTPGGQVTDIPGGYDGGYDMTGGGGDLMVPQEDITSGMTYQNRGGSVAPIDQGGAGGGVMTTDQFDITGSGGGGGDIFGGAEPDMSTVASAELSMTAPPAPSEQPMQQQLPVQYAQQPQQSFAPQSTEDGILSTEEPMMEFAPEQQQQQMVEMPQEQQFAAQMVQQQMAPLPQRQLPQPTEVIQQDQEMMESPSMPAPEGVEEMIPAAPSEQIPTGTEGEESGTEEVYASSMEETGGMDVEN